MRPEAAYRGVRVLVTGHTGFKGSWLTEWLLSVGAQVVGVSQQPETDPNLHSVLRHAERMQSFTCDIRDRQALLPIIAKADPEIVFHLAAQPLVRRSYRDPEETWSTNVVGTVNVLDGVRFAKAAKACLVITSDKCYENLEQVQGYDESDRLGGADPYSASKAATELVAESYRLSFFEEKGIQLATARAGNVIGGGDWSQDRIITDVLKAHTQGSTLTLRYPDSVRPWQHVLEPLSGYLALGAKLLGDSGSQYAEAWNFGPAESAHATVLDLANAVAVRLGDFPMEAGNAEFHETTLLKLDSSKAAQRLGCQPVWNFEQTIDRLCSWYSAFYSGKAADEHTRSQISEFTAARDAA